MGISFSIFKRAPKHEYVIGKHKRGWAPGTEPTDLRSRLKMLTSDFFGHKDDTWDDVMKSGAALRDPGYYAIWSIMASPNYAVFKMTRFSVEELADLLYRGAAAIDTREQSIAAAKHLLAWAGDADCVLNPEEKEDVLETVGFRSGHYRETGNIWEAIRDG